MQQSTTRRTLHYYWQVTRKHKGLFWGLIVSTFLFVALLSYGNPYVMSLVVDRVSEGGVGPDEVFSAYGPYIVASSRSTFSARRQASSKTTRCISWKSRQRMIWLR